ncbi:MAG: hypothetical protein KF745_08085 [Phycisphaeraceae bacterium]|nr:hypothetical protein [Phycisphaeraceae bacterium]
MRRRVVITGLGTVSGLGIGAGPLWEGLLAGRSAIGPITRLDASGFRSRLAAELKDFSAKDFVPKSYRKAVKVMARDIELAVAAAKCAVEDARLLTRGSLPEGSTDPWTYPSERMGCHIGAGLIAAETDELTLALSSSLDEQGAVSLTRWGGEAGAAGMDNLTPLWLLKYLPNMLACHVTIIHGAEGPSNTITCAEASGLLSIGESMRIIERGSADLCFSGGAESKINHMGILRMDLAGRLAATGDATSPDGIIRPYSPEARGTLLGEGGGILVLEAQETAAKRGAKPYAEIAGFGASHSTFDYQDAENDEGFRYAIENAIEDAGITGADIDAVVPLGSGIPMMDRPESGALRAVLGDRAASVPKVLLCPSVGNCMAGAGGIQAAVAALCLRHQRLPGGGRSDRLRHVLVCSGALGGQNGAVVLRSVEG